jgi:hypothetical protein
LNKRLSGQVKKIYVYRFEEKPVNEWPGFEEHLKGAAELAASFAEEFGCAEWGYLVGLRHEKLKVSLLVSSSKTHHRQLSLCYEVQLQFFRFEKPEQLFTSPQSRIMAYFRKIQISL